MYFSQVIGTGRITKENFLLIKKTFYVKGLAQHLAIEGAP